MFCVDDQFPDSPKMELLEEGDSRVLADAIYIWTVMGCDCRARETDGRFTIRRLHRRSAIGKARTDAAEQSLVRVGLWEAVAEDERQMHNWDVWNDTKEQSDRKKRMRNTRQRRWRSAKRGASGDASVDRLQDGTVEDTVDRKPPRARAGKGRVGQERSDPELAETVPAVTSEEAADAYRASTGNSDLGLVSPSWDPAQNAAVRKMIQWARDNGGLGPLKDEFKRMAETADAWLCRQPSPAWANRLGASSRGNTKGPVRAPADFERESDDFDKIRQQMADDEAEHLRKEGADA